MKRNYTASVEIDVTGDFVKVILNNNKLYQVRRVVTTPLFLHERVAMLRLTDINRTANGEIIGRKLSDKLFTIYLTYDEFRNMMLTGVNK
jgi:hypothetical protein